MVYLHEIDAIHAREQAFPYKNCYGLSPTGYVLNLKLNRFPYNELLWFIFFWNSSVQMYCFVSVQRIVMVYRNTVNELLDKLKFPYNELLWFIMLFAGFVQKIHHVSVQRIVMVYRNVIFNPWSY